MRWLVPAEWDGKRSDRVLAHLSGAGRRAARLALEEGAVTLDGAVVAPRHPVATGQVLDGLIETAPPRLQAEDVPFGVSYEDQHLAVVDKPAGIVTHPGAGERSGTLAAGILKRWPDVEGVGVADRWGIVHRLDKDTSGLLVVALHATAFDALAAAIKAREIVRRYSCLVMGRAQAATGTIDAPMGRDPHRPTRMRIDAGGRRAVTHYRVETEWAEASLLTVTLDTGRTHQIRVHLASIGLPVAGDRAYGNGRGSPRVFLHSTHLAFTHPVTGEALEADSPLPPDLETVLGDLGEPI